MKETFTPQAKKRWESIPRIHRERIIRNVWCGGCMGSTTIVDYTGQIKKEDLILRGICATCGHKVARLIEKPEGHVQEEEHPHY